MTRTYTDEPGITPVARPAPTRAARKGTAWLVAVAMAFLASQFTFVPPHLGLGFDESVYVSQVSAHAPASFFSAPRARGISYLVAPVAALTSSITAIRCYLAVLSSAALLGSLWAWRCFYSDRVLALAGVLFAGLWITQFYGPQAMPNLWVAFAALACVGLFLRSVGPPRPLRAHWRSLAGTGLCAAAVVQLRPPDGFWLALPLFAVSLAIRPRPGRAVFGALLAGLALGGAQWIVEAYTRYGGVGARLHTSGQVEGGFSWNPAFTDQLRSLGGRTLCRPCTAPWHLETNSLWWFTVPVLVAGGVMVARRDRRLPVALLPAICGLSIAAPYLLLINYAAPRFLLPSYALLSLPAAACVRWIAAGAGRRRRRPYLTAAAVVIVAVHLAIQNRVLTATVARNETAHADFSRIASDLNGVGMTRPCLITGVNAIPIGFVAGCASGATAGNNANMTVRGIADTARRRPVAVLVPAGHPVPFYARAWRRHRLPLSRQLPPYLAYVSRQASSPPGRGQGDGRPGPRAAGASEGARGGSRGGDTS
ncbi:hypothetical protein [Streptomyces sp. NBC_01497]|uniref:hypothetical protein n=1 Tax=Streptomyces sp. NBC_01497 TaxID=2903885 RepID=UPI002E314D7D|nr:hypothetical protein [Streptomyces sp. NBC_01497]